MAIPRTWQSARRDDFQRVQTVQPYDDLIAPSHEVYQRRFFLLSTPVARRLYHEYAAPEPILDFHCHLSPGDIASNRTFRNLFEIWLEGDHYKMARHACQRHRRASHHRRCARPREISRLGGHRAAHLAQPALPLDRAGAGPLFRHRRTTERFQRRAGLGPGQRTARHARNSPLGASSRNSGSPPFAPRTIPPTTSLRTGHWRLRRWRPPCCPPSDPTRRSPCISPACSNPGWPGWPGWSAATARGSTISRRFLEALRQRVDFFHAQGCRLCDHGLEACPGAPCTGSEAAGIFERALGDQAATRAEQDGFAAFVLDFLGRLYAEKGWTMQLHLGALRNNSSRKLAQVGPDAGFDSIGDFPQAARLAAFLDRLDREDRLPKTIIYNLNPADNYMIASMIGNFQDGVTPGKVQMGAGWWFLDQKEAMEWQLNALSQQRIARAFRGHGDRFALVHVVSAARVFPANALPVVGSGRGQRGVARRRRPARSVGARTLPRQRRRLPAPAHENLTGSFANAVGAAMDGILCLTDYAPRFSTSPISTRPGNGGAHGSASRHISTSRFTSASTWAATNSASSRPTPDDPKGKGSVTYWGVGGHRSAFRTLLDAGASEHQGDPGRGRGDQGRRRARSDGQRRRHHREPAFLLASGGLNAS